MSVYVLVLLYGPTEAYHMSNSKSEGGRGCESIRASKRAESESGTERTTRPTLSLASFASSLRAARPTSAPDTTQ
eukprot:3683328-Rhodomonas_salina.4